MRHKSEEKVARIVAFEFNTPSPDDVVKEKQKDAFVRREFASAPLLSGTTSTQVQKNIRYAPNTRVIAASAIFSNFIIFSFSRSKIIVLSM